MHPECRYVLDCAVELGEITPMESSVFMADTSAAQAFEHLMSSGQLLPDHWLRNTARQYLDSLPRDAQYVWALQGLNGQEFALRTFLERIEFVVQQKVQADLGITESPSFRFVPEAGWLVEEEARRFGSVHEVTRANVVHLVDSCFADARARLYDDLRVAQEACAWVQAGNQGRARELALTLFKVAPAHVAPTVRAVTSRLLRPSEVRRRRRSARSAIKKVVRLFSLTGSDSNVRLLVSGKEVELAHPDSPFKFVLRPDAPGWLEQKTAAPGQHVPFQLTLLTKEDVFLSRLCVLFDETPVLDQLLALTLFVQSGEEEELLSKANWFGYEDLGQVREVLGRVAPALLGKLPRPVKPGESSLTRALSNSSVVREQEHWSQFKQPVQSWIGAWLGDLFGEIVALKESVPLRLAA